MSDWDDHENYRVYDHQEDRMMENTPPAPDEIEAIRDGLQDLRETAEDTGQPLRQVPVGWAEELLRALDEANEQLASSVRWHKFYRAKYKAERQAREELQEDWDRLSALKLSFQVEADALRKELQAERQKVADIQALMKDVY